MGNYARCGFCHRLGICGIYSWEHPVLLGTSGAARAASRISAFWMHNLKNRSRRLVSQYAWSLVTPALRLMRWAQRTSHG
jgi:hypothetical protein